MMGYKKRIRILLLGLCASGFVAWLLVHLCTTASSVSCKQDNTIKLPYTIKDTQIVLHRLTGFEGGYVEDGSLEEVSDVAALVLENTGDCFVDAGIILHTTTDTLEFAAWTIPPRSRLMVLEKNKKELGFTELKSVEAKVKPWNAKEMDFPLQQEQPGTLVLTNNTDLPLENIVLYHKSYYGDTDMYFGGITYETNVSLLLPGETVFLHPVFYATEGSRVILITENALS